MAKAASPPVVGRPAWWPCLHTAGLGRGSGGRGRPAAACSPRHLSGNRATCCPSEGAAHFLDRVAAPRAWRCLGIEPSQSSPHSIASVGALWTERCWLASVLRRCRPRRTTRRAAPRPRPRAAVVARPRRRSVLTFQPRTQQPWHSMGVVVYRGRGSGEARRRARQLKSGADFDVADVMRRIGWLEVWIRRSVNRAGRSTSTVERAAVEQAAEKRQQGRQQRQAGAEQSGTEQFRSCSQAPRVRKNECWRRTQSSVGPRS